MLCGGQIYGFCSSKIEDINRTFQPEVHGVSNMFANIPIFNILHDLSNENSAAGTFITFITTEPIKIPKRLNQ